MTPPPGLWPRACHTLAQTPLWRLLALALAVRVVFGVVYVTALNSWELVPVAGETRAVAGVDGYIQLARTLCTTGQYAYEPGGPAVHNRPPLHPLLLAATSGWFPEHWYWAWLAAAAALQLLTLALAARTLRLAGASALAVNATVLVLALHPWMLLAGRSSTFVTPALLILLAVAYALLRIGPQGRLQWAAWAGLAGGAAALTHGTLLPVPILVAGLLVVGPLRVVGTAQRWRAAAVVVGVSAAVVLPWTARNYLLFNQIIPVATGAGSQYWKGEAFYVGQPDLEARVFEAVAHRPLHMVYFGTVRPQDDMYFLDTALAHIAAHPAHYALRTAWSLGMFWLPYDDGGGPAKPLLAGACNLPPLLVLAWAWGRAVRRRCWPPGLTVAATVLMAGVQLPFALLAGQTSYFMMLTPLLVLGAVAVLWGPGSRQTPKPDNLRAGI